MPYEGIVAEIPCGSGGLNGDTNLSRIPVTALVQAEGIVADDGTWHKEPGAVLFGSAITGTPSLLAMRDFWSDTTIQRHITAAADGKLYKDDGAGNLDATVLKSGLSATARGVFIEGGKEAAANNRKLFYMNGYNVVQVLSGTGVTTSDISAPPADWTGTSQPIAGVVHNGRLWGWGNLNDPHRLYGSLTSDHEDFTTDSLTMSVFPGVGQKLVAGVTTQGRLFLWKFPRGLFWLDDADITVSNWLLRQKSIALGAADSPYAVLPIDDDVLWLSAEGRFHVLSAVSDAELAGVRSSDLSAAMHIDGWLRDNVALDRLNQVTSCWYGAKRQAVFCLPRLGSTTNDLRLVFDFLDVSSGGPVKFFYSVRDTAETLCMRRDTDGIERPVFGTNIGTAYRMEQPTRTRDGAYMGRYQTPSTDFGFVDPALTSKRKNFDALEVITYPSGTWDLAIDVLIDGVYTQTLYYSQGLSGSALGAFVLGTDALGGTETIQRRRRLCGNGYRLSLIGYNNGDGQDFSVQKHLVSFRPAGEEQGR